MQQLQFIKAGVLEWQEVPEISLVEPTDALVRPIAVARCDLDLAMVMGLTPFRGAFPFGHEFVGEVVSVGESVTGFDVGQRVVVPFQITCGGCTYCHRGYSTGCLTHEGNFYGIGRDSRKWGGALSDMVRVPYANHMLVPIPDGIHLSAIASASDNLSDAWRTVGPELQTDVDKNVLIIGGSARSIGVYAAAIATALGAAQVDYLDTDPERLRLAELAGANPIESEIPKKQGAYAISVDASGTENGLMCALRSVEPGGVCTSVSIFWRDTPIPIFDMYNTGVTFKTGRVNSREVIPQILDLVRSGKLQPEKFTTRLASWDDAPQALLENTTKVIISREL